MFNICVVDDEDLIRISLADDLRELGYKVDDFQSPIQALEAFKKRLYNIVITDLKMPEMDGITLMKHMRELCPECSVIMITAFGTVKTAVEAMKAGAYEYVTKPFQIEEIDILLNRLQERYSLLEENVHLKAEIVAYKQFPKIVGRSRKMLDVLDLIKTIAPSDSSVLIYGETGTGKELIAEAIHALSPRSNNPLIKVSCAALTKELLESELFGHVRGAFTGATTNKVGRFELAHLGTIFLDEVDDIPLDLQVKLLRVIQQREIERVGDSKPIKLDVRILAATKENLYEKAKKREFRQDLYYRLNVVPIILPSLRQRREDIPLLISHFSKKYRPDQPLRFTQKTIDELSAMPWEGNIRELENLIERLSLLCQCDPVSSSCLPEQYFQDHLFPDTDEERSLDEKMSQFEINLIREALQQGRGNKSKAAQLLRIPYSTLRSKMEKYNLE